MIEWYISAKIPLVYNFEWSTFLGERISVNGKFTVISEKSNILDILYLSSG